MKSGIRKVSKGQIRKGFIKYLKDFVPLGVTRKNFNQGNKSIMKSSTTNWSKNRFEDWGPYQKQLIQTHAYILVA